MVKIITLSSMHLRNFKGVKDFTLLTNGQSVQVFGENATGKTTLFDAFNWLLFDKDSLNKKDFSLKTIDGSGEELHKLEHEVSAALNTDGDSLTLKKIFKEKWTKKRGSVQQEFNGHTTEYFVNDVPIKKKEYTDKIAEIIDEDIFKLITNPQYFNEQLKWQDRRKVLIEIAGGVTDEEVIKENPSLAKLIDALKKYNSEEIKKIIAGKRKKINDELEKIPVRIDEIQRNLPDISEQDKGLLEQQIKGVTNQIDEKQDLISNIRNGNAIAQKQRDIQEIEMEILKIKQAHESNANDDIYKLKARLQEENSNAMILDRDTVSIESTMNYNKENIQLIEEKLVDMRGEWDEVNALEFMHTEQCECPTCGQTLPENQVLEAREKALSEFNYKKSKDLEKSKAEGLKERDRQQKIIDENKRHEAKLKELGEQINKKHKLVNKLETQIDELESNAIDITENKDYVAKLEGKQALMKDLAAIKLSAECSIQEVQVEIATLKTKRDEIQKELSEFSIIEQSKVRIAELETEEKNLSAEFEKLEQQLYLTEEFIRTKVNMLESKINSKFKHARFNLFKNNINGGLEEICETAYQGVPYSSGLNNAARINVGLDIINTLSDHYGFKAPIFVDNAEAVTRMIDVDTQVISLVVSEQDKQLRIEI